jgi:hypothetical protein
MEVMAFFSRLRGSRRAHGAAERASDDGSAASADGPPPAAGAADGAAAAPGAPRVAASGARKVRALLRAMRVRRARSCGAAAAGEAHSWRAASRAHPLDSNRARRRGRPFSRHFLAAYL